MPVTTPNEQRSTYVHIPLVFFSTVLALGIAAQWLAWRLRVPSILLLLAFGFLIGFLMGDTPDIPGKEIPIPGAETITDEIIPEHILFPLVSLAVAVIMFEGGLTLRLHELEQSGRVVLRLVTIGVLVTWALSGLACWLLIGMEPRIAILTGAILVVTGPTVIGPLLRHVRPARRIGSIIKWEGIVIDPIGAVLAVLVFEVIAGGESRSVLLQLFQTLAIGGILGWGTSIVLVQLMKRYLIPDFLHNPVFLAAAIAIFAISDRIASESGLFTVTILGVALANQRTVPVNHVIEFKENLRVLLISCLFIILAARIRLDDIFHLGLGGALFLLVLVVIIRPLAAWASSFGSELSNKERWFLALMAPRGIVAAAVSSVFALEVTHRFPDMQGADKIVPLTFLVIVGTVAIYGLAAAPVARRLNLAVRNPQGILFAGASSWIRPIAKALQEEDIPVLLVDTNFRNVAAARMDGLPSHCASIVSEYLAEMDLGGLGHLLALTPNDDLNTLAANEFATVFGRARVFQLAPWDAGVRKVVSAHLPGRYLFDSQATHGKLAFRFAAGSQVKKTKITSEFTFEDFLARYSDRSLVLFVISDTGELIVSTADKKLVPKPGQIVIALVDEVPNDG